MTTTTIDAPSVSTPQRPRRRTSTTSEEDAALGSIRTMEVTIEEADQGEQNNKNDTPVHRPASTMSSLRTLLGVPSTAGGQPATLRPAGSTNSAAASASLLGVPPSTTARTAPPGVGGASGARLTVENGTTNGDGENGRGLLTSEIAPKRKKVVLEPGCSALDWALKKQQIATQRARSPNGLTMRRISRAELKEHRHVHDAWSALNGKVYDLTPYLRFHPGGQQELLRVAGRDGTRLFMLTHSWVNIDAMIDACCIGILVSDS